MGARKHFAMMAVLLAIPSAAAVGAPGPRTLRDVLSAYVGKVIVLADSTTGVDIEVSEVGADFFCATWKRKPSEDADKEEERRIRCYPFTSIRSINVKEEVAPERRPVITIQAP